MFVITAMNGNGERVHYVKGHGFTTRLSVEPTAYTAEQGERMVIELQATHGKAGWYKGIQAEPVRLNELSPGMCDYQTA